ncbi:hypothetical protein [Streptomyces sp. CB03911]|uniref:hypothetical protein n=1 Tax=Streptomyces sp. CB03911 TaxID=1804758 RepID=UPI000939DBBF|nr:hypothetical protein [Streptomyces sp. CB03911]OKI19276.1 hypothetical protein A6A07_07180 [Streptomyces sp. CB03911]
MRAYFNPNRARVLSYRLHLTDGELRFLMAELDELPLTPGNVILFKVHQTFSRLLERLEGETA